MQLLILLSSLLGVLTSLAFGDPPGDGISLSPVIPAGIFLTTLAPHSLVSLLSLAFCISPVMSAALGSYDDRSLLGLDHPGSVCFTSYQVDELALFLAKDVKNEVCPLSTVRDHLQILQDYHNSFQPYLMDEADSPPKMNSREHHVQRQSRRINAALEVFLKERKIIDDDHFIEAATRVLANKLYHRQEGVQKLTAAVTHLAESNMTLTEQVAVLIANLQTNHKEKTDLQQKYADLQREIALLRLSSSHHSSLSKRVVNENLTGSTNSSRNVSAPSTNLTSAAFAERLAKLWQKPGAEAAWKSVPAVVFTFIGYASTINTFYLLMWDDWLPRLASLLSWFVGILSFCLSWCCKPQCLQRFQNCLKRKSPTKSTFKGQVNSLKGYFIGFRKEFNDLTAAASQHRPAGSFVILSENHDALQVKHDNLQTSHNTLRADHDALQKSHNTLRGEFNTAISKLQLSVTANDKSNTRLDGQVAKLIQRLEALEQAPAVQAPAVQAPAAQVPTGQVGSP